MEIERFESKDELQNIKSGVYFVLFIMFIFCVGSIYGQKSIVLSGTLVNDKKEVLAGANIALYDGTDSTLITGIASTINGTFRIVCKPIRKSFLQISFIGYKTLCMGLVNVQDNQLLGTITLETDHVEMKEMEVVASQRVRELDRVIIYPERAQVKSSVTSLDLLANMMLPGLDINLAERTARVMDKMVEFRLNGRKVSVKDVDALSASSIQRVEYIDNPGLEYGKETEAIVNYVTKEPISGFSSSGSLMNAVWTGFGNDFLTMRWNHKRSEFGVNYNTMFRKYKYRVNDQTQLYHFPDREEILREYVGENTPFKS